MSQPKHGGSRPVTRSDDGRLVAKMDNPKAVTIWIETKHHRQLKLLYGRNWQDIVRELIDNHLHAANRRQTPATGGTIISPEGRRETTMKQQQIIEMAKQAGFGCDCEEDCAYQIAVGQDNRIDVVLLPKANGTEALDKFEKLAPDAEIKATRFHYWSVTIE